MKGNVKCSFCTAYSIAIVLLISIFTVSSIAQSGNSTLDSMIHQLNAMKSDTNKVKTLFEIVKIYRKLQPDSALVYSQMELSLSKQLNYYWGIGKANNQIALIHMARSNFTEAYHYFLFAFEAFDKINDIPNKITVYSNISKIFSTQNIVDSAMKYISLTRSLNSQLSDSDEKTGTELDALTDLTVVFLGMGQLDSVIYYNGLVIKKSNEDFNEFKGVAYLTNGTAYQNLKENKKAIENFRLADNYLMDPAYKIQILQGLGISYYNLNQLDSAIISNQLALNLCNTHGFENLIPQTMFNQGLAYLGKKEYKNSILIFNECIQNKYAYNTLKAQCFQFGGDAYQHVQNINKAIEYYQQSLALVDSFDHNRKSQVLYALSTCYYTSGDFKRSQESLTMAVSEEKIFTNEQMIKNINDLEIKYESTLKQEKINQLSKENEIQELQLKNKNQQQNLALMSFLAIGLLGGLGFYRFKEKKSQEKKNALLTERLRLSSELHDEVGSTLSGIAMYSHLAQSQLKELNEPLQTSLDTIQQSTNEIVNKLSDIIWITNPEKDSLPKLREKLEDYLRRMAAIKNIQVAIDENTNGQFIPISDTFRKNVYLLMKEAINNAVKYSDATEIKFSCLLENNILAIGIEDNGKGFDMNVSKGNGIQNMKNRAKAIQADLDLESSARGSKLMVKVGI